jgi:hypothetical protein
VARAVAVLGGAADIGIAAEVADIDAREARSVADLLVRAGVLADDQVLGFVHPIVQAAVYEDLLPGERAARHLAVARLLDEAGAPVERVATHLLQTTPAGEAGPVELLRAAAESAGDTANRARAAIWLSPSAIVWSRPDWAATALDAIDAELGAAVSELRPSTPPSCAACWSQRS